MNKAGRLLSSGCIFIVKMFNSPSGDIVIFAEFTSPDRSKISTSFAMNSGYSMPNDNFVMLNVVFAQPLFAGYRPDDIDVTVTFLKDISFIKEGEWIKMCNILSCSPRFSTNIQEAESDKVVTHIAPCGHGGNMSLSWAIPKNDVKQVQIPNLEANIKEEEVKRSPGKIEDIHTCEVCRKTNTDLWASSWLHKRNLRRIYMRWLCEECDGITLPDEKMVRLPVDTTSRMCRRVV